MDIDARRESGVADLHAFDFVLQPGDSASGHAPREYSRTRQASGRCNSAARHATRGRVCGKTHDPARPTGSPAFGHAPRSGSPPESASSGHLACDRCATSGSPGSELPWSMARLESHSPQERRRIRAATRSRCKARHTPNRTQQETPTFCGVLQSPYGSFMELLVRHENVRQNVRVDRGNYRPRPSSMNLSTDV